MPTGFHLGQRPAGGELRAECDQRYRNQSEREVLGGFRERDGEMVGGVGLEVHAGEQCEDDDGHGGQCEDCADYALKAGLAGLVSGGEVHSEDEVEKVLAEYEEGLDCGAVFFAQPGWLGEFCQGDSVISGVVEHGRQCDGRKGLCVGARRRADGVRRRRRAAPPAPR